MKRNFKNAIYEQFSRTAKALSNPKRIEILDLLSQGEKSVESVAEQTELGLKNASAQLKALREASLVNSRKVGTYVYYQIRDQEVVEFLLSLRKFSENRFIEIQSIASQAFNDPENLSSTNLKQLLSRVKKGEVILIDVRPSDEFQVSHLPMAMSVPINEINKHLKDIPKNKEVVAYCRGPYCFFAKEAVEILRRKGFKASRLKEGVQDWAFYGLPTEGEGVKNKHA